MDMLANVPYVNAPECESLGFDHVIDSYRQYAGPANLAGKRVISSEEGAVSGESYSQTLPELMWCVCLVFCRDITCSDDGVAKLSVC